MKLCDLHTHILPGVDDGAQTMEYAVQMLKNAVASDVEWLAVTPHCNASFGDGNYQSQNLTNRFLQLQKAAEQFPIHLVLGAEVRVSDDLPALLTQNKIPSINNSRYLLTEFPIDTCIEAFPKILQSILNVGYVPLVAHPERYIAVCEMPYITEQWLDMGCHLQLTGGSLMGVYGKIVQRTSAFLLQNDFVACVASDAHSLHGRSNFLLDVYDHLSVQYSKHYAGCLLYENPLAIIRNEAI